MRKICGVEKSKDCIKTVLYFFYKNILWCGITISYEHVSIDKLHCINLLYMNIPFLIWETKIRVYYIFRDEFIIIIFEKRWKIYLILQKFDN
jgi:hypothetical protein